MWIDANNCIPLADGEYMVQTIYGNVTSMQYTHKAGWNTHYDSDGKLCDDSVIEYGYVARWFNVPTPPEVPQEWLEKYRKENE